MGDDRQQATGYWSPDPGPVVLLGENGAGKTNILEAISLLTPGRGLRRAEPLRGFGIGRPDVEMWSLPVVTNEKAAAVFQSPVKVHDRVTVTPGAAGDTIRRLENEAASRGGHRGSLHEMWQQGARTTSTL